MRFRNGLLGFGVTALVALYFFFGSGHFAAPKIYDCFLFYNEFDLLEIRLNELKDVVDKFVIVEAAETFRGKPKPFLFPENKDRFREFADKIIYVQVKGYYEADTPWKREMHQRNQIMEGLKQCHPQDVIMISDVDEIIRNEKVKDMVLPLLHSKTDLVVCEQSLYYGYLNHIDAATQWRGPVAMTYKNVKKLRPKTLRKLRHLHEKRLKHYHIDKYKIVENGGWHFTSMGGIHRLITKLESFSYAEMDTAENKDPERIRRVIAAYPRVPIDESFPKFVRNNQDYLIKTGLIEESPLLD